MPRSGFDSGDRSGIDQSPIYNGGGYVPPPISPDPTTPPPDSGGYTPPPIYNDPGVFTPTPPPDSGGGGSAPSLPPINIPPPSLGGGGGAAASFSAPSFTPVAPIAAPTAPSLSSVAGNANLGGGGAIANPLAGLPQATPTASAAPSVTRRSFDAQGDPSADPMFQGYYASSDDENRRRNLGSGVFSPSGTGDNYRLMGDTTGDLPGDNFPAPPPIPTPGGLPPGASGNPNGQINWTPGSASLAGIRQTLGPGGTALGQGTGTFRDPTQPPAQPQQQGPGWLSDFPVPAGGNADMWTAIGNELTKNGIQVGPRGSGIGDIAYWYDKASQSGDLPYFLSKIDARAKDPNAGENPQPQSAPVPQFRLPSGNFGQDPFSQLLSSGWANIINNQGASQTPFGQAIRGSIQNTLNTGGKLPNDASVQQFEKARTALEAGRRAQMDAAMADLANRGLAPEPGGGSGAVVTAEDYVNRGLAPSFAQAIEDYQVNQANLQNQLFGQAQSLGEQGVQADQTAYENALRGGAQYQQTQTQLALKQLEDSQQFNEFLANYGLNRDQVMYELQNSQNSQILQALYQYLILGSQSNSGHI